MEGRIPDDILTDIRARVNIVEVIGAHVALRKAGRNYQGLCPFHGEKTPSFSVNEERGFFHCFGCGVGGNAFTFLTRIENISFPEAVRRLALKAGVSLPQAERDPRDQERARLYRLNDLAATYFQRCLWGDVGGAARRYLEERGINREVAERFRLGFASSGSEGLVRFLTYQKADVERAASLGLVGKRDNGQYYDKFRYRLMFPITDVVGRIVGFGGRLLPMEQPQAHNGQQRTLPKYLNSPESVLYKKGTLLYGLAQAKETIQRRGRAVLVEGYIDLLALVQHGQTEVVAVLGTALGSDQLKLLRRFTTEVYMFFDGDEAGRKAALRAFPLCIEAELRGRGVFLPQGEDPDTYVRKYGQGQLSALIDEAAPLEDFYFTHHAPPPGATAFQRAQAARSAMAVLQSMTDVVARGALLTQIAQRFGVNEEELRRSAMTPESPSRSVNRPSSARQETLVSPQITAESELLQLILVDRQAAMHIAQAGVLPAFQQWGPLAEEAIAAWHEQGEIDLGSFLDRLPKAMADQVTQILANADRDGEAKAREQLLSDCITKIRLALRKSERERLRRELREVEQHGNEDELRLRLQQLQQWNEPVRE
jgi:DNA primase